MSLRKVFYIFIFISPCIPALNGQIRHQAGINGTQFFKQFIAQNNSNLVENNPYLLTYRCHTKKINPRFGIGGNYNFINEENNVNQFSQHTTDKAFAVRIGADITKQLTNRWFIYYGLDLFRTQNSHLVETFPPSGQFAQRTTITQEKSAMGVAGVLTLEFRINDNITLFTEANLNWSSGKSLDQVDNPDFPDSSTKITSKSSNVSYLTPLSLFFSILI